MNTFTIDAHNAIARLDAHEHSTHGVEKFTSEKELAKLATQWPARRLVEIWNGMPGARRVAKFRDRKTAVRLRRNLPPCEMERRRHVSSHCLGNRPAPRSKPSWR
jgi:hypothetical protein